MNKRIIFIPVISAGAIILLIGLYFSFIKAGIPFQDPTPEMLVEYSNNFQRGKILSGIGLGIIIFSVISLTVYKTIHRTKN